MATMPSVSSVSTATSSTMTTLSNLMSKFLDNVNAGKFVTDIGPGLALTVPLLMLLAVLTGGHFMPLQQAPHLRTQYRAIYDEIEGALDQLAAKLPEKLKTEFAAKKKKQAEAEKKKDAAKPDCEGSPINPAHPSPAYWDWFDRKAPDAVAALEKLHAKAEEQLNANATEANFAKVRERASEKKQLEREIAQLGILRAKLADLQKAYAEATSLTKNLEGWETNLALIAGLAVVLGVIVSQAARFVYFELIFRIPLGKAWRLIRGHRPTKGVRLREAVQERRAERRRAKSALLKQRSPSFAAAYQDLVTNHLRYAEGAVNMSIPVVLFAFVYPCFAAPLVDCHNDQACFLVDLRWTAISVAICLIGSGWFTYLRFREKEREWLSQNLDAVAISEAAAAATKAAGDAKRSADAAATSANSAEAAATEAKKHAANPAARANPPAA